MSTQPRGPLSPFDLGAQVTAEIVAGHNAYRETEPWRQGLPRSVGDPLGPDGELIPTPTDHRWLWHIESFLAVNATNEAQRDLQSRLRRYLNATCQHFYREGTGYQDEPLKQCLWCCDVIFLEEPNV